MRTLACRSNSRQPDPVSPTSPWLHPSLPHPRRARIGPIHLLVLVLVLMGWLMIGCTTTIPGASPNLLAFLHPGETTRQEVVLKLGQPSGTFEQDRILTYRLGEDGQQGYFIVTPKSLMPWSQVRHSLVLVFDARGVLEKQSLVPVQ